MALALQRYITIEGCAVSHAYSLHIIRKLEHYRKCVFSQTKNIIATIVYELSFFFFLRNLRNSENYFHKIWIFGSADLPDYSKAYFEAELIYMKWAGDADER